VQLLLAHKTTINAKDNYGWTALHLAALKEYEAVKRLLKKGATEPEDRYGLQSLFLDV
jgi:ankyrin repeat protein